MTTAKADEAPSASRHDLPTVFNRLKKAGVPSRENGPFSEHSRFTDQGQQNNHRTESVFVGPRGRPGDVPLAIRYFASRQKKYTVLEVMLDRCLGRDDPMVPILQRKLSAAIVTLREHIPANVVTLSSRATYRVNDAPAETCSVAHDEMRGLVGSVLSITNLRRLALLDLAEGERMTFVRADGSEETVWVENVVYQPEASLREKAKSGRAAASGHAPLHATLRGVLGSGNILLRAAKTIFMRDSSRFDDPGPSSP